MENDIEKIGSGDWVQLFYEPNKKIVLLQFGLSGQMPTRDELHIIQDAVSDDLGIEIWDKGWGEWCGNQWGGGTVEIFFSVNENNLTESLVSIEKEANGAGIKDFFIGYYADGQWNSAKEGVSLLARFWIPSPE